MALNHAYKSFSWFRREGVTVTDLWRVFVACGGLDPLPQATCVTGFSEVGVYPPGMLLLCSLIPIP